MSRRRCHAPVLRERGKHTLMVQLLQQVKWAAKNLAIGRNSVQNVRQIESLFAGWEHQINMMRRDDVN